MRISLNSLYSLLFRLWLKSSNFFKKKCRCLLILFLLIFILKIIIQLSTNLKTKKTEVSIEKLGNPFLLKKNDLNLNDVVLEEENVGREEGDIIGPKKDYINEYRNNKDLNAAVEALSQQQNGKENFPVPNINDAIANLRKKGNPSIYSTDKISSKYYVWHRHTLKRQGFWNHQNFSKEEINDLSTLGRRLFLHENIGIKLEKKFIIYIYKFGKRLERRLIHHYTNENSDPFEDCSVNNCELTYNHSHFHTADAVMFHLHLLDNPPTELERKNFQQRWVWLSDESVFSTFMVAEDQNLSHYNNFFNWSMTYRIESDVPVPYGRTVPLLDHSSTDVNLDIFSKKNKTIAIMGSNCSGTNGRWKYVEKLQKYIEIDVYGNCGKYICPGRFDQDCHILRFYKFYLAFENSNCKEYITEKAWWNAFAKEAIPVVMGPPKSDYQKLFPPNSFIHVDDFNSIEDLAIYLKFLLDNKAAYNKYHAWRSAYRVVNEHGYFGASVYHYCRLCEALNYNSPLPKTYSSMEAFWNESRDCNIRGY